MHTFWAAAPPEAAERAAGKNITDFFPAKAGDGTPHARAAA
jgi:hypothetical protein